VVTADSTNAIVRFVPSISSSAIITDDLIQDSMGARSRSFQLWASKLMAGKPDVLAPGPLEDHPELSAKMKWRKLNGQSRPPRSSKGLNSATG